MPGEEQQNAVSLKLPTFWTTQPQVWFEQAEAQFHIRQITADNTRYYYVVSALDQNTAGRIIDYLREPPDENKYEGIKTLLNTTFGLTRRERAAKLLHMDGLGDRKPSELMNEMLALMEGHKSCLLFEQIFLEQMPEDIRLLLAQYTFTDPRSLAARADELWQTKQQEGAYINRITALPRQEKQTVTRTATPSTANRDKWCYYH
ncbi:hypothetical protein Pcinc_021797 [Petrolisthes cinctipes]|uniref:DUF7041 domain-containing protein n=1 Tax=Petrolisthes cinctipes TaxID=88211 RepID=A0AAE1KGX3_PETCI|nr:hypothetical protein Pcinc_021797 [Petrolisthes cinctipes]